MLYTTIQPIHKTRYRLISVLFFFLVISQIKAQLNTWTGATDTSWHKGCNWDTGNIPTCSDSVVIPTSSTNHPAVTDTAHCAVIELNDTINIHGTSGARLYIGKNGTCAGSPADLGGCFTDGFCSAHRYWRIWTVKPFATAQIKEMEYRSSISGFDQTGTGTASASSEMGIQQAPEAFDDDNNTFWRAYWLGSVNAHWLKYDFGSGNEIDVKEILIRGLNSNNDLYNFRVQFSDDDTDWTTALEVLNEPDWSNNEDRTYSGFGVPSITKQPISTGYNVNESVFFQVTVPVVSTYQWQENVNGGSSWNNITNGGSNPTYSGTTTSTLSIENISAAMDGNLYRLIATTSCGSDTSTSAQLTLDGFRYWRIYTNSTEGNRISIAEIELRESAGGADQTGSGSATASVNSGTAGNSVDNNSSSEWRGAFGDNPPQWWSYDFGAGTTKDIDEWEISSDVTGTWADDAPLHFELQFSDDNSTWTTVEGGNVFVSSWSAGESRTYNPDTIFEKGHTFWRILLTQNVQHCLAKVEFREFVSGNTVLGMPGVDLRALNNVAGHSINTCLDTDFTDQWIAEGNGFGGNTSITVEFPGRFVLKEVALTSCDGAQPLGSTSKDYTIQYSDNGLDWTTVHTESISGSWSNATEKVLNGW